MPTTVMIGNQEKRAAEPTRIEREKTNMTEKIKTQILAIRDTGLTNMFDKNMMQRLAYDRGMYELVMFLEDEPKEYVKFIMYGPTPSATAEE